MLCSVSLASIVGGFVQQPTIMPINRVVTMGIE